MSTSPSEPQGAPPQRDLEELETLSEVIVARLSTPVRDHAALAEAAGAIQEFADRLHRMRLQRTEAEGETAELLSALTEIEHMEANLGRVRNPGMLQPDDLWPYLDRAFSHGRIALAHLRWA